MRRQRSPACHRVAETSLRHSFSGPEPRDHLGPPALLLEASLDEVGGPHVPAMDGGKLEVGQAGVEVLLEGPHGRRIGITCPRPLRLGGGRSRCRDLGAVASIPQVTRMPSLSPACRRSGSALRPLACACQKCFKVRYTKTGRLLADLGSWPRRGDPGETRAGLLPARFSHPRRLRPSEPHVRAVGGPRRTPLQAPPEKTAPDRLGSRARPAGITQSRRT